MMTHKSKIRKKRNILSVDLDANPEVRDALATACEASGNTPSRLAIESLCRALPGVLEEISQSSAEAALRLNSTAPVAVPDRAADVARAALATLGSKSPTGEPTAPASAPDKAGRTAKVRQQ